ncbi:MAG: DUF4260 domain-containing protein [Opitutus sp.]|nr:DUF4260 domain-containing protein [Opitutus sp.]
MTHSGPKLLLHVEGAVVLVAAVFAYAKLGASWGYFALLFFVPDISMVAYAAGTRAGAWSYNAAHTYFGPALLAVVAYAAQYAGLLSVAVVWIAHIGFDRLLGYGLKYPSNFKDTHLHRV